MFSATIRMAAFDDILPSSEQPALVDCLPSGFLLDGRQSLECLSGAVYSKDRRASLASARAALPAYFYILRHKKWPHKADVDAGILDLDRSIVVEQPSREAR